MKKFESDAKIVLNHLGRLTSFLQNLDANASKEDSFNFPLEIIRKTMMFDVSVLYKVSNIIENRLILEIVKVMDPKGLRVDLKEGRKLRLFLDNPDKKHVNEVRAFLNRRTSYINVPGMGCDIMGYVYLPENFGGAYLFGGDFGGKESSIKDHEVACIEIMCNFLSTILLKTRFEHQAEYDNLTGLYNSGKIKQKVEVKIKRFARKPSSSACIVMGDIDFFKKVNDTYGHIQGDLVLKKVGDILSKSMREVFDVAGRYGGEEFLLIFDETNEETGFQVVERLRKNIEKTKFEKADETGKILKNKFLNITMSFGISGFYKDSGVKNAIDWISRADNALYKAKQNGRNKTIVFKGQ
ncbi:MAG: GGDEF domain-containing protein [Desulfobacula sp.]|uniref:GGDEF domain-containing protein n=1 Tax=Desulfobacula sp. TaxID=2593537 RepID=UPI0025BEE518|nr:GGDEF domain-containing protein [Desulfobacula sp.]MCD4721199.1 GGDEF domain-containing protein [Desulfobacula sp.]